MAQPAIGNPNGQCNIAIGYQAMKGKMTSAAVNDICIGFQACSITSGANIISIGDLSGGSSGQNDIFMGQGASQNNGGASNNVHLDPEGSLSAFGGSGNVVIGTHTGFSQSGGAIVGADAVYSDINSGTGYISVFGTNNARALLGANGVAPSQVVFIGGFGNVANTFTDVVTINSPGIVIGIGLNKPSEYDTAIGYSALNSSTQDGNKNAAFGYYSLNADTTGGSNSAFGYQSGDLITTGGNNTIAGFQVASSTLTTGSGNILLGTSNAVTTPASSSSNFIDIGQLLFFNKNSTAAPTVSSCGTSPAIDTKANMASGTVTVGSGTVSSCTITFASALNTWNHCRVTSQAGKIAGLAYTYTTTAITVTATSLTSDVFDYQCDGF